MPVGMNKDNLDFDVIPGATVPTKKMLCALWLGRLIPDLVHVRLNF